MTDGPRPDGRIPLTIVGGFLGAGKSTWLRHQLHEGRFGQTRLLVNEAAETPVDNLLLGKAGRIEVLAGGCACCEGRAALLVALRSLLAERDASPADAAGRFLLETSGLADPGAIADALAGDAMLARRLFVDRVIVLVDALHAPSQLAEDELARRQIEAGDAIIVTKPREAARPGLARLVSTLRLLNPDARIEGAERGVRHDLPEEEAEPYALPVLSAVREPIRPCRLDVAQGGGWASFSVWLSALLAARGDDIVRVKGVVTSPAGRLLLQSVRKVVQPPEILPEPAEGDAPPEDDRVVLLGRGMDEALLSRSWRRFAQAGP